MAEGKTRFTIKRGSNSPSEVLHSALLPFNGNRVHDKEGNLHRIGGGPTQDLAGQVFDAIEITNNTINALLHDSEKLQNESEELKHSIAQY